MLTRSFRSVITQSRGILRPPPNKPYKGIYRKDGEVVCEGELLVCQGKFNYMPGLNVYYADDRGQKLLKAKCDGTVRITTEIVERITDDPLVGEAVHSGLERRSKLTFNVIPIPPSQTFNLASLV